MDNNFNQQQYSGWNQNYNAQQYNGQNQNYNAQQYNGENQNYNYQQYNGQNQSYNAQQYNALNQNYNAQQANNQNQYYNQNQFNSPNQVVDTGTQKRIRKSISISMILGFASAVLLTLGLVAPCIDFSHFHDQVDIQYNLMKICSNVGLISSVWKGIPYGIIIGIVIMVILSFIRIPQLKLIPCILIAAMFVIMMLDMGNVVDWINGILGKYPVEDMENIIIADVFKSMMAGIYLLAAGWIVGLVSCFVKSKSE